MKKILHNALCLLLSASVLFATTGVVIASHICHQSKKADVTLYESHGCCKDLKSKCNPSPVQGQVKKNCCDLNISYHKLEVFTPVKISLKKEIISLFAAFAPLQQIPVRSAEFFTENPSHPLALQKLKAGSADFLYATHTLLI